MKSIMRIAYIVSAYQYPEQLIRLVVRLNSDQSSFFIHVDKRTEKNIHQQMVSGLRRLSNVYWLERHECPWGGFGHVAATLKGIRAISEKGIVYDYVVLLTGQDYPIKTNHQIQNFFQKHQGELFLDYFPLPSNRWEYDGLDRIQRWHFHWLNKRFSFPPRRDSFVKRKFPSGFKPFGGSSYWCLPWNCVAYIDRFVQEEKSFVRFFKTVEVPDEIFFQTIIMNSPHKENVTNDNLRYIDWKDIDSRSPAVLVQEDFIHLVGSAKLFARKFDTRVDDTVLDMIDKQILGWDGTAIEQKAAFHGSTYERVAPL